MSKFAKHLIVGMLTMLFLSFTVTIYAEEHDLVMYDYVNKTEYQYSSQIDFDVTEKTKVAEKNSEKVALGYIPENLAKVDESVVMKSLMDGSQMKVVYPSAYPNSTITHLKIGYDTNGDGKANDWYIGSGFIVGPNVMLTAAHCFWSEEYGWAKEVKSYLKYEETTKQVYSYPESWICSTAYTQGGDSEYDWCVVTLQKNVGATTGWLGFGVSNDLLNKSIKVGGFTYGENGRIYQFQSPGKIQFQNDRIIKYNASTLDGQSGGPVFDSDGIAWGIHAYGGSLNSGCKINSYLYDLISQKREEGINKYK